MDTEEIFAKRDKESKTLTVTQEECTHIMMNCKPYEWTFFDDKAEFRCFKVIVT